MKQRNKSILGVLVVFGVCIFTMPILVHADIFLKPNQGSQKAEEEEVKKNSWFSRFMEYSAPLRDAKRKSDASPYYDKIQRVAKVNTYREVRDGPSRNLKELMEKAEALKAPNIQAMREMREINQRIAAVKMDRYLERVAYEQIQREHQKARKVAAAVRATDTNKRAASSAVNKKRIYRSTSPGLTKPTKVFTDY